MPDLRTLADPAPMEGHGGYNRSSAVQGAGALPALSMLEQAAREAALPAGDAPVVVADYGSSEGRNSLVAIGRAIDVLRARIGPDRAVSVVHTDLPGNDFSALFQLLASDPGSYLRDDPAVFASAVGRSFYEQVLPPGSVALGWSAWAAQWLSRIPAPIPDHVQVACSRDAAVRAAYQRQAAQDWRTFLTCRSRELRPGGRLVVLTMAQTEAGDFGYKPVLAAMDDALRDVVAEGLVQPEEAAAMAIPTVGRTRAEFAAPFSQGTFAGLRLERLDMFEGDDRIWQAFVRDRNAAAFGASWAAFSRASVLPTLARALAGGAEAARAMQFIARMEAGMADRLAAAPEPSLIPLAAMVIVRSDDGIPS